MKIFKYTADDKSRINYFIFINYVHTLKSFIPQFNSSYAENITDSEYYELIFKRSVKLYDN